MKQYAYALQLRQIICLQGASSCHQHLLHPCGGQQKSCHFPHVLLDPVKMTLAEALNIQELTPETARGEVHHWLREVLDGSDETDTWKNPMAQQHTQQHTFVTCPLDWSDW